MEISVDNLLKIPAKYLSEYLYILTQTALGRVPTYALVNAKTSIQGVGANRVDEGLWMFLLVSLIFGWILQSIPAGSSNPPTIGITILILACWVAFSAVSYGFCHLIGGRGEFLASLSAMLQVLGAVYVVSSFGSLVLGVCFDVVGHRTYRYFFYFALQFLLLMRYITMAIRNHGFTRLRRIVAGLMVAAVFVGLNIVLLFYGVFGVALKDVQMNGVRGFGGIGS